MELIDRDALLKELMLDPVGRTLISKYNLDGFIKAQPTVEAIPVEWLRKYTFQWTRMGTPVEVRNAMLVTSLIIQWKVEQEKAKWKF